MLTSTASSLTSGHFGDVLPSQSLGLVLKKVNPNTTKANNTGTTMLTSTASSLWHIQWMIINLFLERCNPWPRRQSPYENSWLMEISQLLSLSLWRHSHYDILQPPFSLWCHSHCDVIHYWAGQAHHYGRRYIMDTLLCLIYKDFTWNKPQWSDLICIILRCP